MKILQLHYSYRNQHELQHVDNPGQGYRESGPPHTIQHEAQNVAKTTRDAGRTGSGLSFPQWPGLTAEARCCIAACGVTSTPHGISNTQLIFLTRRLLLGLTRGHEEHLQVLNGQV